MYWAYFSEAPQNPNQMYDPGGGEASKYFMHLLDQIYVIYQKVM